MIRRILTLIRQDFTNSIRDNIILYVLVAPLLLSFAARLFVPSIQSSVPEFAVDSSLAEPIVREIERFGTVTLYDHTEAVRRRVLRNDDVAGFVAGDTRPILILQGNEGSSAARTASLVAETAFGGGEQIELETSLVGEGRSYVYEYVSAVLLLTVAMLGGMAAGFAVVDDRAGGSIRALAITPLRMVDYVLSKTVFTILYSVVLGLLSVFILVGGDVELLKLIPALAVSGIVGVVLGLVMGLLAENQIAAIGIAKVAIPLFATIPILAFVVPAPWQWVLYPFPNYWIFLGFLDVLADWSVPVGFWFAMLVGTAGSVVAVGLCYPMIRRRLRFR